MQILYINIETWIFVEQIFDSIGLLNSYVILQVPVQN